jgi:predicted alpha-1,2-mannosidase
MTSWTPQTRAGEIKCVAPYYYVDTRIQGFRGSHFLSGSCVPDYGSFTLMPLLGTLKTLPAERSSAFDRSTEHATPYAYAVNLKDYGITAEITGTVRSGLMRFTFTKAGPASLVIDNNARGGDGWVHVDAKSLEVTGEVPVRREYAGSGKTAGFSCYFVIEFNQAFRTSGTWVGPHVMQEQFYQAGDGLAPGVVHLAPSGPGAAPSTGSPRPGFGAYVQFGDVRAGNLLLARTGTSFVSLEEARKNLRAEVPFWDFDQVRSEAKAAWERSLDTIRVENAIDASPPDKVFYTAMYHALLQPRIYSDVSGTYPGFAGEGKVEQAKDFTYYDDFSMWDIFRAQLPLFTIIEPARDIDMVKSLLAKGRQGGFLPIYPAWNSYTSEMIGDHSSVAIVDAYTKGLTGFDVEEAYRLVRQNAVSLPKDRSQYLDGQGRRALDSYLKYGYIPLEDHVLDGFAPHTEEQVSRTLEYAYDDAMIGEFAARLGKQQDAELFHKRGQNWRNAIDPVTGFARGRHADGSWVSPFDPAVNYRWITEGLPWQYTFFVPQDVPGLIALEGGNAAFVAKLDALFTGNFYDHGNEPSHHIAYLYDAAGAAWKTQQHVRSLMESQYHDAPDGLAGNDDAGQMSAWYILSALGFYQVAPGIPDFWLGSPRFDTAEIRLPGGRTLKIEATGAGSGKVYVRRVFLNGRLHPGYKLSYQEIVSGGVLRFEMSDTPVQQH